MSRFTALQVLHIDVGTLNATIVDGRTLGTTAALPDPREDELLVTNMAESIRLRGTGPWPHNYKGRKGPIKLDGLETIVSRKQCSLKVEVNALIGCWRTEGLYEVLRQPAIKNKDSC